MAYDVSSNLIRTINPLGQINTSVFDLANRWWRKSTRWGTAPASHTTRPGTVIRTMNPLG